MRSLPETILDQREACCETPREPDVSDLDEDLISLSAEHCPELNPTAMFICLPRGYTIIPIFSQRLRCMLLGQSLNYPLIVERIQQYEQLGSNQSGEPYPPPGARPVEDTP